MTFRMTVGLLIALTAVHGELRPESDLTHSCYNFPSSNFNRANCVKSSYGASPHAAGGLEVGESAFDFTLQDVTGTSHSFSELLAKGKPVVMVWGMWTCPAYQGLGTEAPFDQCSYQDEYDLVEQYKDIVSFVHLVGPEPHPLAPDTNFDSGKQLMNYWSTVRQPMSYSKRVVMAKKVADKTHPDATLLVDSLVEDTGEEGENNGVWCTMGLGARTAMLVGTDGTLQFKQDWFNAGNTADAIETYLEKSAKAAA